ncbi:hypothetical protein DQ04_15511000 [Trypanosoma grayi]|uniref:hypothetical protein n=1 Tax=Trypanosoma grayi TaxID=71804 RepID=UPI0004F44EFF|nr:hypothetical protein DQ04_15511000 [Trypanosoma grayi]KEG06174.1 hypothetical protein DQ04_15511000 [Trypanosoma grayi]
MMATVRRVVCVLAAALCCTALCVTAATSAVGVGTSFASHELKVGALAESVKRAKDIVGVTARSLNEAEELMKAAQARVEKANAEAEAKRNMLGLADAAVSKYDDAVKEAVDLVNTAEKRKATTEDDVRKSLEKSRETEKEKESKSALHKEAEAEVDKAKKKADETEGRAKTTEREVNTVLNEAGVAAENAKRAEKAAAEAVRIANDVLERAAGVKESARRLADRAASEANVILLVADGVEKATEFATGAAVEAGKVGDLAQEVVNEGSVLDATAADKVQRALSFAEEAKVKIAGTIQKASIAVSEAQKERLTLEKLEEDARNARLSAEEVKSSCSEAERVSSNVLASAAKDKKDEATKAANNATEAAAHARTAVQMIDDTIKYLGVAMDDVTDAERSADAAIREAKRVEDKIERSIKELVQQKSEDMPYVAVRAQEAAGIATKLRTHTDAAVQRIKDASSKTASAGSHAIRMATATTKAEYAAEDLKKHAEEIRKAAAAAHTQAEQRRTDATARLREAEGEKATASEALTTATRQEAGAKSALQQAEVQRGAAEVELAVAQSSMESAAAELGVATKKKTDADRELQEAREKRALALQGLNTAEDEKNTASAALEEAKGRQAAAETAHRQALEQQTSDEQALAAAGEERAAVEEAQRKLEEEQAVAERKRKKALEKKVADERALVTAEQEERHRASIEVQQQLQQTAPSSPIPATGFTSGMATDTSTNAAGDLSAAHSHDSTQARLQGKLDPPKQQLSRGAGAVPIHAKDRSQTAAAVTNTVDEAAGASVTARPVGELEQAADSSDESAVEQAESVAEPAVPVRDKGVQERQQVGGDEYSAPLGAIKSDWSGMLQETGNTDSTGSPAWVRAPLLLLLLCTMACLGAY